MKVKKLIDILKLMDPDAEVCIEKKDSNIATSVLQIVITDPLRSPGIYVYIGDDLSVIKDKSLGYGCVEEASYSEIKDLDNRRIAR